MTKPRSRAAAAFGFLAALHLAVLPAVAADDTPYFRLKYNEGPAKPGTDETTPPDTSTQVPVALAVTGGPSGAYKIRTGGHPNAAVPTANKSPVTWTVVGDFPAGLNVNSTSGAIGGAASVARDYGPAHLVATYTPAKGEQMVANGRDFSVSVVGPPALSYVAPATVAVGSGVSPITENLVSPRYTLNQTVPSGLAFDEATGVISVLPGASGAYTGLAVTVVDALDNATLTSNTFGFSVGHRPLFATLPSNDKAVVDVPYSLAFDLLGFFGPTDYVTATGALPDGLGYCRNPDRICGTPTKAGTFTFTVNATDADKISAATHGTTILVESPSLTYADQTPNVGKAFSVSPITTHLGGATYAFKTTQPVGVDIDPRTGTVSGSLSTNDTNTVVVTATNQYGSYDSNGFKLTGKLDAFSVKANPSFVQAHVGYPVSQTFTATTTSKLTWSLTSGTLPVGLTLDPTLGLIWGSGTSPETVNGIVVTATAGGNSVSTGSLQYQILPLPTVTAAPAYTATAGQPYTLKFTAANLIGAGGFSTDATKLPPGLSLSADGTLSGTPSQVGPYDGIVVNVADAFDGSAGRSPAFTISVVPADGTMMAAGLPDRFSVRVGNPLATQAPSVTGTTQSVTWSLAPDSAPLPDGMALDPSTGVISGTPTRTGDTAGLVLVATEVLPKKAGLDLPGNRIRLASNDPTFVVAAGTTVPRSARTRAFTISVAPPLTVGNVQPSYAIKVAAPVSVAPQASGVLGSTSWTLSGGTLPNAVGFDPSTGRIAGPALTPGRIPVGVSDTLVVTATDSFDGATAKSPPFVFTIDPGLVVVGPSALVTRTGTAYNSGTQFSATNAQGSLTWQVLGTLPDGFQVNPSNGSITGQSGRASVTNGLRMQAVQGDNTAGVSAPFNFVVQGGLEVSYPQVINAHINQAMPAAAPTVTGAQGAVSYGIAAGILPPGLKLEPGTGIITGIPTTGGTYPGIQVGASDTTGNSGVSGGITVVIDAGMSWRTLVKNLTGREGTPFSSSAPAVYGAIGNVHYRLVGSLWDWKVDGGTGVVSGSPKGNYYGAYISPDWLIAYDDAGGAISHPSIITTSFPPVEMACMYGGSTCWFNATGGVSTNVGVGYLFNLIGKPSFSKVGTWPSWLELDTLTGVAFGTPPAGAGQYVFTTRLTDGFDGTSTTRDRGINVDGNPTNPNFSSLQSVCALSGGFVDTGPAHLSGTDPSAPITLQNDQPLPSWLTYEAATGRISGTVPSDPSAYYYLRFNEYTLDPKGNQVWMDGGYHYITTYPNPITFEFPPQAALGYQAGTRYDSSDTNQRFQFAIGDSPSFFVSGGTVPPGMTLGSSYWRDAYWLDGIPTDPGTYTFSVTGQATQCNGQVASVTKQVTVTVKPNPNAYVDMAMTLYARVGVPFRGPKPVVVNPPAPNLKWGWDVAWGLPAGLTLDQGDGSIYGTPTQASTAGQRYGASNCCQYGYLYYQAPVWGQFIVQPGPAITMNDISLPAGSPANVSTNATGFLGQVTWSGSNMPPGLGVDSGTGLIVGTPSTPGTYPGVKITGTETTRASTGPNDPNALYPTATSNAFTVTVTDGVAIGNVADQSRILGQPFDVRPTASGFTGGLTWYVVGELPDGAAIDQATGAISGPGNRYGRYPIQVRVASASGLSATSSTFTLSVTDGNGLVPTGPAVWTWGEQVCTYSCTPATTSTVSTPTTTTTPDQVVTTPGTTTTTTTSCTILGGQQYCGTVNPTTGQVTNYQPTYQSKPGTTTTTTPGTTTVIPGTTTVTYETSTVTTPGTCSGRQLQYCEGEGCEARVRGCDAPYSGGDTSYPVGTVAVSCQNPSISPSEGYCPMPATAPSGTGTGTTPTPTPTDDPPPEETPPSTGGSTTPAPAPAPAGVWRYYNYFVQTKHTNGFVVNWYRLQCYVGSAQADSSQCGAPPTAIGSCQINGLGQGTCGSGVPFTDGVTQTSVVASTAGWFD